MNIEDLLALVVVVLGYLAGIYGGGFAAGWVVGWFRAMASPDERGD